MNRELYLCSLLMLAVFAGMIWYLADYVSSNQEALFNNSYNSQQRVLAQENTRGTIYAGTGEVLAQTVIAEDGTSVREYPYKNIFAHDNYLALFYFCLLSHICGNYWHQSP